MNFAGTDRRFGVIILAGGHSSRMRFPKCFLQANGSTLLRDVHDCYDGIASTRIIILNAEFASGRWQQIYHTTCSGLPVVLNLSPEYGRSHSLRLGLQRMRDVDYCFIQDIDNPALKEVNEQLAEAALTGGYVVPRFEGRRGHPVLLSRKLIDDFLAEENREIILRDFLRKYPCQVIDVNDPLVLLNLNTPEDYKSYKQLSGEID